MLYYRLLRMQQETHQTVTQPPKSTKSTKSKKTKKLKSVSTPTVQESAPPVQESAPPVQESAPPVQESAPPVQESTTALKKPKKTRSPYNCYSMSRHPLIKKDDPAIQFGAIQKQISSEWKLLTDKQKESYVKLSETDKERYNTEMAAYNSQPEELKSKTKKAKKVKYSGPPRTKSIYMLYKHDISQSIKKETPEISFGDLQKQVGVKWTSLKQKSSKDDVKQYTKYEKLHLADKARFEKEFAVFKEQDKEQES